MLAGMAVIAVQLGRPCVRVVKAYEYRTCRRSDHRLECRRCRRLSRPWHRRTIAPGGRAGGAVADGGNSGREVRHRARPAGQARRPAMADLAGFRRQQSGQPRQQGRRPSRKSPVRSRARPSSRASRSASRSWSRPTAPASWPPSCRPACGRSRPRSRRKPAPAASSCPTTASTSSCPSARRIRTATDADVVQSEIILSNVRVLAIDQAPKEKEGINALVGRTVTLELKPEQAETLARARQSGTLALALRSIADVNDGRRPIRRTEFKNEAKASTWFATGSPIKRRHRSDRKDARDEVWGKSVSDANRGGAHPVIVGCRRADARSAAARRRSGVREGSRDDLAPLGSVKMRFLSLGIGKSVVIDLPRDVKDVLVADPKIANAVDSLRATRLYHRRRGRPDQRRVLRRRRPAGRFLRHRGQA